VRWLLRRLQTAAPKVRQLSLHGNPDDIEAHMTEKPSEAYLAGYFFGRDGRRTERRFDAVGVELKA
jgi:hypothetical protein